MCDDKVIEEGFFNMDLIRAVCECNCIIKGKQLALEAVEAKRKVAKADNVRKAISVIDRAKTVKDLGLTLTNWMFAHPSENLKVIR